MLFYGKSFAQKSLENKGRKFDSVRSARNRERSHGHTLEVEIERLRAALDGIAVWSVDHKDAKDRAAKALSNGQGVSREG